MRLSHHVVLIKQWSTKQQTCSYLYKSNTTASRSQWQRAGRRRNLRSQYSIILHICIG